MATEEEVFGFDNSLPPRLFATDRYPDAKPNIYSKPDIISFVRVHVEPYKDVFDKIRSSQFGSLFDFPVSHMPPSCKLIHGLMLRQLVTKKKYEMWSVFGGQPLRFSVVEFGKVTGLSCVDFPDGYNPKIKPVAGVKEYSYWEQLIGLPRSCSLADVGMLLKNNPNLPDWRRLKIALLLLVDGVLIANDQVHKPTLKYVDMLENLEKFLEHPWGRESYLETLSWLVPKKKLKDKKKDPLVVFCGRIRKGSVTLKGFPLVLQLVAFKQIPDLLKQLPNSALEPTLMTKRWIGKAKYTQMSRADVFEVENLPNVSVKAMMRGGVDEYPEWGDEFTKDKAVIYMEKLISGGHKFSKSHWHGGDAFEPLYEVKIRAQGTVVNKHILLRKAGVKRSKESDDEDFCSDGEDESEAPVILQKAVTAKSRNRKKLRTPKTKKAKTQKSKSPPKKQNTIRKYMIREDPKSVGELKKCMEAKLQEMGDNHEAQMSELSDRLCLAESEIKSIRSPFVGTLYLRRQRYVMKTVASCRGRLATARRNAGVRDSVDKASCGGDDGNNGKRKIDEDDEVEDVEEGLITKRRKLFVGDEEAVESSDMSDDSSSNEEDDDISRFKVTCNKTKQDYSLTDPQPPTEGFNLDQGLGEYGGNEVDLEAGLDEETLVTEEGLSHNSNVDEGTRCLNSIELVQEVERVGVSEESMDVNKHGDTPSVGSVNVEGVIVDYRLSGPVKEVKESLEPTVRNKSEATEDEFNESDRGSDDKEFMTRNAVGNTRSKKSVESVSHLVDDKVCEPVKEGQDEGIKAGKKIVHEYGQPVVYGEEDGEGTYKSEKSEESKSENAEEFDKTTVDQVNEVVGEEVVPMIATCDGFVGSTKTDVVHGKEECSQYVDGHDKDDLLLTFKVWEKACRKGRTKRHNPSAALDTVGETSKCYGQSQEFENLHNALFISSTQGQRIGLDKLLCKVDKDEWNNFAQMMRRKPGERLRTVDDDVLSKKFFLVLGKKKDWVSSLHMDLLMNHVREKHRKLAVVERMYFAEPWILLHIQDHFTEFWKSPNKHSFPWSENVMKNLAIEGAEWYADVKTLYIPMLWDEKHWVGLVIQLSIWDITILDPNTDLYANRRVAQFMAPVIKTLPYLVKRYCRFDDPKRHGLKPFSYSRKLGIYKNIRSGDCGPLAVKFLEIHANGASDDAMENITDSMVDDLRKDYALRMFATIVRPEHH